jgi:hypothetical protein
MLYNLSMYAVVRHTFEQDVSDRLQSVGEWKHHVWLFEEEEEAMTFAITLLDHPLLLANEHSLDYAIETLETGKFFQVGRESVAIAKVMGNIKIIYKKETEDGESVH